jgi:hypothetical protein
MKSNMFCKDQMVNSDKYRSNYDQMNWGKPIAKKYFETRDFVVEINDTEENRNKVFEILLDYFRKYQAFDGETIMQSDDPQIYAPDTLSDIADLLFGEVKFKDE